MTDLLLIHPGAQHGIYGELGGQLTALEPPLWCRLIAGYIRDRGFSVKIIDAEAEQADAERVAMDAKAICSRLICIAVYGHQPSASTQQMTNAGEIARELKKHIDAPIIMVGGHPSALPEQTLKENEIDYVGIGEGPLTILGLLRGDWLGDIPGLLWNETTGYVKNPPAPLIDDLSQLLGNVWELLPMEKYRSHNWQAFGDLSKRQPYASIYTSLGCPYKCSFCCINAPFDSNRYRVRKPLDVVQEIRYLRDLHGVFTFKITDEMFVLRESHYTAICELLAQYNRADNLNIWAYSRIDTVKPDKLALLRAAGIRWLALGIESGSKYVRDGANKRMRTEDIVGTVKTIQGHGISVIGNFMFGLRDDDHKTMQQTFDLAIECMPDFANFYSCMAYPGSALYDEAKLKGWTLPPDWRSFSQHNSDCRPLDTEHISGAEVLAFRDAAFNFFFTHPSYLSHVERRFGAEALEHVKAMTQYKLKRKLLAA